jgi:diguanylate cyclase (GGDEF)-like protein/PAS domain S-box-containing protein
MKIKLPLYDDEIDFCMDYKSLQLKIIIIFSIPALALIYFSFSLISSKNRVVNYNSSYMLLSKYTDVLSKFTHNIQLERGLSAGCIANENKGLCRDRLLQQREDTDVSYKLFMKYIKKYSNKKCELIIPTINKTKPKIKNLLQDLHKLNQIRESILKSSISFEDEIQYYTNLNTTLLEIMGIFTSFLNNQTDDNNALVKLQKQKESAGLERAYIYNTLLSDNYSKKRIHKIRELVLNQKIFEDEFKIQASLNSIAIYNDLSDIYLRSKIKKFREDFFESKHNSIDAKEWFALSSKYIDELEAISSSILLEYINKAEISKDDATHSLYITALLWTLSFISFFILMYILRKLIVQEQLMTDELRIAAYTFDSHEAMTITDVNGTIIKVNKAFTDITGYSAPEVIGKNPRVLKSMKHSEEFYKDMWYKLHTVGKWSDEIYNKRKNDEIYPERLSITAIKNSKGVTTHYIAQFLDISDIIDAQKIAKHQADHDFLTGLLNRKALMIRLREEFVKAKRHDFLHAFLFIDLDNFKVINDTHGHNIGDMLIIEVAKRLKDITREEDIVCRLSGDEFAIIISNVNTQEMKAASDVKDICREILDSINKPYLLNNQKVEMSSSIGVKLFPENEKSVDDVIIHADTAMYQAKHFGKNQFVFFDYEIEKKMKDLVQLEQEIKNAFKNNEFEFYYQPKVDVSAGNIVGAEMLVRWNHPTRGLLYPDSFISVVNNLGHISKFSKLALQNAIEFLTNYSDIFDKTLAINVSSTELLNANFEKDIIELFQNNTIAYKHIELEITETDIINDFDLIISKIKNLQKLDIKFSIDDFCTGYSSLTYLQKLPVNTLKIDREFFLDLDSESNKELVRLMANMANTFNMEIVAEGIEDKTQLDFISQIGIKTYQGYYFSKAINKKSFVKLLRDK